MFRLSREFAAVGARFAAAKAPLGHSPLYAACRGPLAISRAPIQLRFLSVARPSLASPPKKPRLPRRRLRSVFNKKSDQDAEQSESKTTKKKDANEDEEDHKRDAASNAGDAGDNDGGNSNWNAQGSKPKAQGKPNVFELEINLVNVAFFVFSLGFLATFLLGGEYVPEITEQEFRTQYLEQGQVARLQVVNGRAVRVFLNSNPQVPAAAFSIGSVETFERHLAESYESRKVAQRDRLPVNYIDEGSFMSSLFGLVPTLMFLGFLVWMGRRAGARGGMGGAGGPGGMFGVGKSKAHRYDPKTDVKVRFDEVAGMDEAKVEITEFVKFLKNPAKYERLGAKIPRGAILSGAPGTGKTMLAKATAGEAGVPFFAVSGSEFVEMFSGVGASRVRDLFKKAKESAPSMIWIDEIDAIGKSRSGANIRGGNDEREATLNQLLVEMDGFGSDEHVVVLAGTNRSDVLDKALLRPGRFDRHITIDLPTLEGRKDIFRVHLRDIAYDRKIEELPGKLAAMTPGFSGADIANCCNEAALAAARDNAHNITMIHFDKAIDRVIAGLERRSRVLPVEKRKIVAYHEAGHAIAGWFLKNADPLVKVTIVPHGAAALGYAQLLPGDSSITTEDRLRDLMTVAIGGRVAEELFFETVTVGASDDFKRILALARAMVTEYGMSPLGAVRLERPQGSAAKGYSQEVDAEIDAEIKKIIDGVHERCKALLSEHKDQLAKVAEELLSKELLTRSDLVRLLGPRPYRDNENEAFKKYLDVA